MKIQVLSLFMYNDINCGTSRIVFMGKVRGNYYTRNHTQLVQQVCYTVREWLG